MAHMPDLGHQTEDLKVFTWHLTDWNTLDKAIVSHEFKCGGYSW